MRRFAEVDYYPNTLEQEEANRIAGDYDAIFHRNVSHMRITEDFLRSAGKLKCVGLCRVGMDNVPLKTAEELGISVFCSGGCSAPAVAETTIFHILNASRRFVDWVDRLRAGGWKCGSGAGSRQVKGKTVGLIGYGHIGKQVAQILLAMGANVLAYAPSLIPGTILCEGGNAAGIISSAGTPHLQNAADTIPPAGTPHLQAVSVIRAASLEELLTQSDIISLHCPLTKETEGLIDAAAIGKMKDGACLINMARGKVVVDAAVEAALISGKLAAFSSDVAAVEPIPADYSLAHMPGATFTPHIGDWAEDTIEEICMYVTDLVFEELKRRGRE